MHDVTRDPPRPAGTVPATAVETPCSVRTSPTRRPDARGRRQDVLVATAALGVKNELIVILQPADGTVALHDRVPCRHRRRLDRRRRNGRWWKRENAELRRANGICWSAAGSGPSSTARPNAPRKAMTAERSSDAQAEEDVEQVTDLALQVRDLG
jgi:hypothetical protein